MSYKVAVASSDGKVVNRHFGHTKQFLVFDIEGDKFNFLELRENFPPCTGQEHHDDRLAGAVDLVADCRAVLVSQIGPGAAELLVSRGIQPYVLPEFIEDALNQLISLKKINNTNDQE